MMRKRRFAYSAWLLFAILLYFFENNTGTRTILADQFSCRLRRSSARCVQPDG